VEQILGQSQALDVLQAALRSGRVHHAFIFHGPVGVGKFTAAKAFAKVLLCHDPQHDLAGNVIACAACESCRLAGENSADTKAHPDLHIINKELARYSDDRATRERKLISISIDLIRDNLIEPAYRSSNMRHGKVFIVDEAELLAYGANAAQNAMLKVMEEPPEGTYFILVTSSEDKLLPTIRSRCQRVAFLPLPVEVVTAWIDRHATPGWSAGRKAWLTSFAAGSLGRAQLAVKYDLANWADAVLPALDQLIAGKFPLNLGRVIEGSINDFATRWVDEHENASKEAANKLAAGLMWVLITQHARRRVAELAANPRDGADVNAAEAALEPWLNVIDAVAAAEYELATNVNLGIVADHVVARMGRTSAAV
jgi:DNA polymerase-3 subunit delta'